MKLLRVWLLVLIAVLLPVRGVMAAAMPCPPAAASHAAGPVQDGGQPCHQSGEAPAEQPASDMGGCDLCSACGFAAPLPSTAVSGVPEPLGLRAAATPEPGAPAPSFLCGGLERPPRTH